MNRQKIKELIELVEQSDISELEVHFFGGRKVVIRKNISAGNGTYVVSAPVAQVPQSVPVASSQPAPVQPVQSAEQSEKSGGKPEEVKQEDTEKYAEIKAPMVGTFYRKPSPDSPPYVNVGDHIDVGQVVCLIEAMKLFNEVKSEISGTIKKILVEDASPVEFGQVIFLVEPD